MNLLLAIAFLLGGGNAYEETFSSANAAYNAGNYAAAIQMYEQIISESVVSPAVFFNLGNAYFRTRRLGLAIANYERALQLEPGFDGARENLANAVRYTKNHLARPQPADWQESLLFWHYNPSTRATDALAISLWLMLWITLGIRQWRPLRYTRGIAVVTGVLAVAFGLSAWAKAHPEVIVVANTDIVHVHYGTDENETVRFDLSEGDRATVDNRMNGWSRVSTADGERGWARDKDLVFVGPPYERPAEVNVSSAGESTASPGLGASAAK